jgi:hypothetical protein
VAVNWPDAKAPWVGRGYEDRWRDPVAAAKWERRASGTYVDWVKVLPCPRCGHTMSVTVAPGAFRDARPAGGAGDEVLAGCDCESPHEGRPETRPNGCGYMAMIPRPARDAR